MTSNVSNNYKDATVGINMVALNEDNIIDLSLESIRDIADEVIFVDNGSTDQTVNIVKKNLNPLILIMRYIKNRI